MLNLRQNGEVIGIQEHIAAVFERCKQRQGFLKVEIDVGRLLGRWRHADERSGV